MIKHIHTHLNQVIFICVSRSPSTNHHFLTWHQHYSFLFLCRSTLINYLFFCCLKSWFECFNCWPELDFKSIAACGKFINSYSVIKFRTEHPRACHSLKALLNKGKIWKVGVSPYESENSCLNNKFSLG